MSMVRSWNVVLRTDADTNVIAYVVVAKSAATAECKAIRLARDPQERRPTKLWAEKIVLVSEAYR